MDKFTKLPDTKQKTVIDAALDSFSANGYKKASVNDIAVLANISKALIFHYFGSKKSLYIYLIDYCIRTIKKEINEKFDQNVTDFFDRLQLAANIKISVMKKHPAILSFLSSMYHETDKEVTAEVIKITKSEGSYGFNIIFENLDVSKFKDNVDPQLVMKMISWLSEGYINKFPTKTEPDIDHMMQEFDACIHLLKNNLYKEV